MLTYPLNEDVLNVAVSMPEFGDQLAKGLLETARSYSWDDISVDSHSPGNSTVLGRGETK